MPPGDSMVYLKVLVYIKVLGDDMGLCSSNYQAYFRDLAGLSEATLNWATLFPGRKIVPAKTRGCFDIIEPRKSQGVTPYHAPICASTSRVRGGALPCCSRPMNGSGVPAACC
jgi:hypothetical protein